MTIPSALHQQIVEKAQQMNMGFDETVTTLLRIGLETQTRREAELEGLVEDFEAEPTWTPRRNTALAMSWAERSLAGDSRRVVRAA